MLSISIIMPAKDREKEIEDTIQSILDQTFNDWELIVVDDHSIDKTAEIVKNLQRSEPQVKYLFLKKGAGPGAARDFGIKKAKSEIIVLADSDDINYPNRLEITNDFFQKNPSLDIAYGRSDRVDEKGQISPRPTCNFNGKLLKYYNFISNVTTAFKKRRYLETKGYDPKIKTSEDYDLWLNFLERDFKFGFIDKPLVLQKIHSQSVTAKTDFEVRKKNLAYVRQKHHLPRPLFSEVKKIVKNKELLKFISTPSAIDFWFS